MDSQEWILDTNNFSSTLISPLIYSLKSIQFGWPRFHTELGIVCALPLGVCSMKWPISKTHAPGLALLEEQYDILPCGLNLIEIPFISFKIFLLALNPEVKCFDRLYIYIIFPFFVTVFLFCLVSRHIPYNQYYHFTLAKQQYIGPLFQDANNVIRHSVLSGNIFLEGLNSLL